MFRLISGAVCALFAVLLIAAGPAAPPVVVFPYTVTGTADPALGAQMARQIGAQMRAAGVTTNDGPAATPRSAERDAARAQGAEYYITGILAPVGPNISVITQLVSVRTGTMVWSNSELAHTVADAAPAGDAIKAVIDGRSTRSYALFATPEPTATPAPKKTAAPKTTSRSNPKLPTAKYLPGIPRARTYGDPVIADDGTFVQPPPGVVAKYAVIRFGGTAGNEARTYAAGALVEALIKRGQDAAFADEPPRNMLIWGDELCHETGAQVVFSGNLSTNRPDASITQPLVSVKMDVQAYDCARHQMDPRAIDLEEANFIWKIAVDHAADKAALGYLGQPGTRRS